MANHHRAPRPYRGGKRRPAPEPVDLAFNPNQPRDSRGRWVRLPGADEVKAVAQRVHQTAVEEEPIITGALVQEAEKQPGYLGGFAFRLKTEESLERKIETDTRDEFRGNAQAAANNIKDANRYTLLYRDDQVATAWPKVLNDLQRKGFHATKVKDWFSRIGPLGYRGVNVQMETPGGQPWELQFHTPTSFESKSGEGHRLYEEYRTARSPKRKRALALASANFYQSQVHQINLANHYDPKQPRDPNTGKWIPSAAHIVKRFKEATPGEREAGRTWYPSAHSTAVALSKKFNVSVDEAAGLLANYSPQTPWGRNQVEAAETLRYGHGLGGPKAAMWFTHDDPNVEDRVGLMATGNTRRVADEVLGGMDFEDAVAGRNKNGSYKPRSLKVRNFYHLIAHGGQEDPENPHVVIDRHAMSVALGHRLTDEEYGKLQPGGSYTKYAPYVQAYADAAKELTRMEGREVTPEEVQATTWLAQQRFNQAEVTREGKTRKKLGNKDWAEWTGYAARYLGLNSAAGAAVGYSELSRVLGEDIDLATPNPTLGRTRRITRQLLEGQDARQILTRRGIKREVADAVSALAERSRSTATRPNARRQGEALTVAHRIERDREALYRGAYLLKASERVQKAVDEGKSLKDALHQESRYYAQHEQARRNRLDSVHKTQVAARHEGTQETDRNGAPRTLLGWYRNPALQNDPECLEADGNNFYAEEGTMIGFPGGVHNGCGCVAGPAHEGAAMVNDILRGAVGLEHIGERPRYTTVTPTANREKTVA
jgi:hypothetical protein